MRVLVLTQYFPPEITASAIRLHSFARGLARRGHTVDVVCEIPNHPRGVVEPSYRGSLVQRRAVDGFDASYVWVRASPSKTVANRIASYGSFALMASVVGSMRPRPDVVLASSPPLPVAAAGMVVAARHRAPLLLDVRDLWPESAVALGELRTGALLNAIRRLERLVYAKADRIVTTNGAFRQWIAARAPANARIGIIPNGTTAEWLRAGESDVARSSVGLPRDRLVWAYAGNIGLAHGLEFAVDAAGLLGDDFLLLVIGDGARAGDLERRASAVAPSGIERRGLMPAADAARHLRAADVLLVSESQEMTVSAKLYDVCAIGRPVVVACRGELRRLVDEERIGLAVDHGDPEALAGAVRRLRSDPELGLRLSERARSFARRHLREREAERLAELAESLADPS